MGPSANPILIFAVLFVYFIGSGYLCYLFGKKDAHSVKSGPGSGM